VADIFDEDPHTFSPETLRLATQLGWGLLLFAGLAASLTVATVGYLAATAGAAPQTFTWFSFAVAAALLASFTLVPFVVLAVWTIVAARWIQVDRRSSSPPPS
jgi:hypothetical protein